MSKPNYNSNQTDLNFLEEQEDQQLHQSDPIESFVNTDSLRD